MSLFQDDHEGRSHDWGQAIDDLIDDEKDDESVEYEYESDDSANDVDERTGSTVEMPDKEARTEDAQLMEDSAVTIEKDSNNDDDDDDDWSHISESEMSGARNKIKKMKITGEDSSKSKSNLDEHDAMSIASSWSLVRSDMKEGQSHAGSEVSSLKTFQPIDNVKGAHSNPNPSPNHDTTMSLFSSSTPQTHHSNLVAKIPQLNLPSSALDPTSMVPCPRCTMDNLPGAQTCVACELPITANPQTDIDHQIALRLAAIMEEEDNQAGAGGDSGSAMELQDMQSLLLDGTIRPRAIQGLKKLPIQEVYQWADIIAKEVQAMSNTLGSQKVCNVVSTVVPGEENKDRLVQYLVRFREQWKGTNSTTREAAAAATTTRSTLAFGYFLTSRPYQDVVEQGVATQDKGHAWIIPAEIGCVTVSPSWQLKTDDVPDYVWLVLLDQSAVKNTRWGRNCVKPPKALHCRHREEDEWRVVTKKTWQLCYGQEAVPLLCTANANFRRPYKPRLNTFMTDHGSSTNKSIQEGNDLNKTYLQAYTKMRDAILKSMHN